jgi:NAD(P)-dependent dehydrogenase (short-subunit alcohol dehydrogenase family)
VNLGLAGRAAFVTGGAQGIGRAIVERLLAEGARVAFVDIDEPEAARAVAEIGVGDRILFAPCDVRSEDEVEAAISATVARFGSLDVLVNNAGVNSYGDATSMTEADWDRVFSVDLKAAWLCAKHALPSLIASGHGAIVNISSIHATLTIPGMFPYGAAKAGLLGLTRSLALDYGPRNVRVNAVCPGYVRTRLVQEWLDLQDDPAIEERIVELQPLGRIGEPAEVASLVTYLASDEAGYLTGATFSIDGGMGARFAT